MQDKSNLPPVTFFDLPPDILVLILLAIKIDDPIYFISMSQVCRSLRERLNGEKAKPYWQLRLKDFLEEIPENVNDYKKLYIEQWQSRKRGYKFSEPGVRQLSNLVRQGKLKEIRKKSYSCGARYIEISGTTVVPNAFVDNWVDDEGNALFLARKYDRKNIQEYIYQRMIEGCFKYSSAKVDYRARTQLHWAVSCGMVAEIERLRTKNNLDAEDTDGNTPLFWACYYNQHEAVDALLAAGASVNFNKRSNNETPIFYVANYGNLELFNSLKKAGADLHHLNKNGRTPLFLACISGNLEVVEALLAAGAKVNHTDSFGQQPLHFMSTNGSRAITIAKALVLAGANVNYPDAEGITPLHRAAQRGHTSLINFLVVKEALVNQPSNTALTPLFVAASHGQVRAVNTLIALGAIIDGANSKGETPLLMAAKKGHVAVFKALLAAAAHVNLIQLEGITQDGTICNLLALWRSKVKCKDKSLCEQVLAILSLSLNWSTSISSFFSKPEIINILDVQKCNPELNNNVEHLMTLLQKYQQQIPAQNFEFIMEFILPKEVRREKVSIGPIGSGEHVPSVGTP
jgi:ankyrin repeat protein